MAIDIEKTRRYYSGLGEGDRCDCAYCRNFYAQAREACPGLARHLASLGVDILYPLRLSFFKSGDAIVYYDCMYTVFGDRAGGFQRTVGDVTIAEAAFHPSTGVTGEHFVISAGVVTLEIRAPELYEEQ